VVAKASAPSYVSLADRAYSSIRDRILTLDLAPGTPVHEDALMRDLAMGRTPIREALKRLALEDLVVVYPRRGTFVTEIEITDLAQISDLRIQLEGHAAYRAAERATSADQERARELISELEALAQRGSAPSLMAIDTRIHRFVYGCARNAYLESAAERCLNLSLRIWHLALDRLPHLTESVLEHRDLLDAIIDRKPPRARRLAEKHVADFEREIRNVL
jgi:DNA-binding GntR family transcriptional regulator